MSHGSRNTKLTDGFLSTSRGLLILKLLLWKGNIFRGSKTGQKKTDKRQSWWEIAECWSWKQLMMYVWPEGGWFSLRVAFMRRQGKKSVCVWIVVMGVWRQWEKWPGEMRRRCWQEGVLWLVRGNRGRHWGRWNYIPRWLFMAASWRACVQGQSVSRQRWSGQNT